MQDRYVGDVGDFGKYALLRRLCGLPEERPVSLGMVWCLFPDETHNADGRHISYLGAPEFRNLDVQLITALRTIVETGRRCISSVLAAGVLPPGTVSCDLPVLTTAARQLSRDDRLRYRAAWLARCLDLTADCDLVFFDPDNGMAVASVPKHHPKAGKYIYWNELAPFWQRGNALLIYHHLNRTVSAARQVEGLMRRFAAEFDDASIIPLVFRRGSSRVFWLVHIGDSLGLELENRAADLLSSGWSRHFRPLGWPVNDQARARTLASRRSITFAGPVPSQAI
jgi:hypothetical protein